MPPEDEFQSRISVRISPEEFPAAAFTTICGVLGGVVNAFGSAVVLDAIHLRSPELVGIFTVAGIVGGVTAALLFIRWVANQDR